MTDPVTDPVSDPAADTGTRRHPGQVLIRHPWWTALAVLALAIIVLVLLWDWNWFKGPVERRVEAETGRSFEIGGNLDVDLGWVPTIRADKLSFGNASWSKEPTMASADRLEFDIELKPLLFERQVRIPVVRLTKPDLLLERGPQNAGNWQFGDDDEGGLDPQFRVVWIDAGHLQFVDAARKTDIDVDVATEAPKDDAVAPPIVVEGGGRWEGTKFTVEGRAESPRARRAQERP